MKKSIWRRTLSALLAICVGLGCMGCGEQRSVSEETPAVGETSAETEVVELSATEKRNRMGFGFYRMPYDFIEEEAAKGYINTYMVQMAPYNFEEAAAALQRIKNVDGMAWLSVGETVFLYTTPPELLDTWQGDLQTMMDTLEQRGLLDAVIGFYFDEPFLWQIPKETFRDVTKAMRETYPDLRTFACFAVNAIDPAVWSNGNDQQLDYDTARYLTDVAFDYYAEVKSTTTDTYRHLAATLESIVGEDTRLWFVPCTMKYQGKGGESGAITHTNFMYTLLKKVKNPGGLLCYAYDIPDGDGTLGNVGYKAFRDRQSRPWTELETLLETIGKEITKGSSEGQ